MQPSPPIAGLVLAGGRSSRLGGGDKPLLRVGGETILSRILKTLEPQVAVCAISANGDPARFVDHGLAVLPDLDPPGSVGPLSGILAGLDWAAGSGFQYVLTVPGDTPFLPNGLARQLVGAVAGVEIAVAASAGRRHPVVALWPAALRDDLFAFISTSDRRSVAAYLDRHRVVEVDFPPHDSHGETIDPFFNVNTLEDLEQARRMAGS